MKLFSRNATCLIVVLICLSFSCNSSEPKEAENRLFDLLPAAQTKIAFKNTLSHDFDNNIFEYDYFYNGAGVAAADFDNDGLVDLFFAGNQAPGKLYLNKGGFKFEDITATVGIQTNGWCTGVSVADVNRDGWPDIYVCHAGLKHTPNQLFIHSGKQADGRMRFSERAKEYGLDYKGFSTQAAFFDYDRDGDLDMYLLNHFHEKKNPNYPKAKVTDGSAPSNDKLFRNNGNNTFSEVSRQSGIISEGFGLGVAIADINQDDWPDVYVANDFAYDDLLYINNGDGTFAEKAKKCLKHTSRFSMGCDAADINNDLLPDIFVADMLPDDNRRQKLMSIGINNQVFNFSLTQGYLPQYSRNTLQINNGLLPDGDVSFSEIGQLAGVYKTDWSWSALFADLDNDGWKDLFVSNGIPRDVTNLDFATYRDDQFGREGYDYNTVKKQLLERLEELEPVNKPNFVFQNNRNLTFSDQSRRWGLDKAGFSNGAALADLDNDGDLDLVTNNLNEEPFVFRNNANRFLENNHLTLQLKGHFSQGAKVKLTHGKNTQYIEHSLCRGFQSTQQDRIHIGLGKDTTVDALDIVWPDGRHQRLTNVAANRMLVLDHKQAAAKPAGFSFANKAISAQPLFTDITASVSLKATHQENNYEEFNIEPMLPHRFSQNGPQLASGDINGDGLEDFWMSGAASVAGKLFFQQKNGGFVSRDMPDPGFEDAGGKLFDADGDKDLDLYVVSGGNEYNPLTATYQDRLYMNDGRGNLTLNPSAVPVEYASGSCVVAEDFDRDGDLDLFVGGRVVPGRYPSVPESFLFVNDGKGNFHNATQDICPALAAVGMVTDAVWADVDNDRFPDLMVVGEFMPVTLFRNNGAKELQRLEGTPLDNSSGWWHSIVQADFDRDGDVDFFAGNLGLNNRWGATRATPVRVYAKPLPNGSVLPVLTYFINNEECTWASRDQIAAVYPPLKVRFNDYQSFASQPFSGIFPESEAGGFEKRQAVEMRSLYIENRGKGKFAFHPLPTEAQFAPIRAIQTGDFNKDGTEDVLLLGNDYTPDFMTGRYDAFPGLVLAGDGKGRFKKMPLQRQGLSFQQDVRSVVPLSVKRQKCYLVGTNQAPLRLISNGK